MKKFSSQFTANQMGQFLGLTLDNTQSRKFDNVAELKEANSSSICFYENKKFIDQFIESKAGLIFVPQDFDLEKPECTLIKVAQPYINFMMLVKKWLKLDNQDKTQISETAFISNSAKIGKNVSIDGNVVISDNVTIGENCIIEANCVVKKDVIIGKNSHLYPNVTIYQECEIGKNNILHSGVVIGADGFGYIFYAGQHHKVPQVGNVILCDDVEVGANSCIDRGTLSSTIIGKGTKIDNLVQVGHNCQIGENSICCAQVGLAGSTKIGNVVYIAGQAGLAGHLTVEDNVLIGAQSGVTNDLRKGEKVFGTPAIDAKLRKRIMVSEKSLPEMAKVFRKEKGKR